MEESRKVVLELTPHEAVLLQVLLRHEMDKDTDRPDWGKTPEYKDIYNNLVKENPNTY